MPASLRLWGGTCCVMKRLVLVSQRKLDVDAGQQREDVCLQYCDQNFEQREDENESQGSDAEESEPAARGEQEERGGREEQHQQEVTDNHVHQQSQRQGNRPQDE